MIKLHQLPESTTGKKKRLGQGLGSGKGKTAGRGTKGQRARGAIPKQMGEAGNSLVKRLPLYRGKYKNKPKQNKSLVINIKYLSVFSPHDVIDEEACIAKGILKKVGGIKRKMKILGDGNITIPLTIRIPVSKKAAKKIQAAGGTIETKSTK